MRSPASAIILAAGASRRLGRPKQLLRYDGRTFLEGIALKASQAGCNPVLAVLGHAAAEVASSLGDFPELKVTVNESWEEGMASSIRAGVDAVQCLAPDSSGALLLLCDQPNLAIAHLAGLLKRGAGAVARIVASRYPDGALGVPAYFPARYFAELRRLEGDEGARLILKRYASEVMAEPLDAAAAIDIDTLNDWQTLQG